MTTSQLAGLQRLDSEADRARQRIAELERLLRDRSALEVAEADASAARDSASDNRRLLRERELELKSLEARIADLDEKLYSGRIRNPKELEGFEREARMFRQNHGKLEETVLALMETADASERAAVTSLDALKTASAERERAEQQWRQEADELRGRLSEAERLIAGTRGQVDADDLRIYDRLRRRTAPAVVALREQRCGACNIGVSTERLEQARDESTLAQCDNCGRILVAE